jgi:hypothetical protein
MWISLEVIPSDHRVIFLPKQSVENNKISEIKFGERLVYSYFVFTDGIIGDQGKSFDNPIKIKISERLKNDLLIPDSLIYQMTVKDNKLIIGPVIGFLLGNHNYLYNPKHMEKYSDRFGVYKNIGGLVYAFTPKSISWERNIVFGLYYNVISSKWEYGIFPLPSVVYRRNFHTDQKTIERLIKITNNKLFNSHRFTKFDLYKCLSKNEELLKYVPSTEITTDYKQIKSFIDKHKSIILKPVDLSRGRGICLIKKTSTGYKVSDYRSKEPKDQLLNSDESLEKFFINNESFFSKYLIQKCISLATIDDCRYDIRVVMQKNDKHVWQCTGIECRVGGSQSLVTNISRGGYALSLDEALRKSFKDPTTNYDLLIKQVHQLSNKLAIYLDTSDQHFSEFGMDIAIDVDKNLWIIEVNVFPSFKGFKKMNYPVYLDIRHTPLLYALSLTEFKDSLKRRE